MKFLTTVVTLVFACFVSANSGIFSPDGQVALIQSEPSAVESNLVGSNADRMRKECVSPVPRALCGASGHIQISRASDGAVLGYIRKTFNNIVRYTYDTQDKALVIKLPAPCDSGAFDLVPTNGPDAAYNNVGAVTGIHGFNFKQGRLGYAYLSGTGHVDANSPPSNSTGTSMQSRLDYNGSAESQIWSLNHSTGGLTAQWTNADSTNPATSLYYARTSNYVGLVGDFHQFVARFAWEDAFLVTAAFYPTLCGASGYIQISRATDGVLVGYVRKTFDGDTYTSGTLENALIVKLPASCSSGAFDLVATNGPDAVHNNVGAVGGSDGYNFNPGNLGYAYLSGTGHSDANSPPSFSAGTSMQLNGYDEPSESQIWTLDYATRALTAQWTNADSSNPITHLFYAKHYRYLGLVGDFNKFVDAFPTHEVVLVNTDDLPHRPEIAACSLNAMILQSADTWLCWRWSKSASSVQISV
ncbi:hypothetical protein B0H19DRAFT_1284642 [Mycena capillaripes]|nr:hypothetical protein B0H19DRAFT_1284642 [Mycena capillaripes]